MLAITGSDEHRYPAYDANGNVGQLIDEAGELKAAYSYDPFGNVTESTGAEAETNSWRFSTKPVEESTGWSYYGFRYYMPQTGRWASRDPFQERGGVNLYGFVGNDGVGYVDLLGLLEGNEKLKIILGPHGAGPSAIPNRNGGGNGGPPWTWLSSSPITSKANVEKYIAQGIKNFEDGNEGITCPWNNYEIVEHGANSPLTLEALQNQLSSGADYYFLVLHGSRWGDSPLVEPNGRRDAKGNFKGRYYTLKSIIDGTPDDAGHVTFQCCHSSGVDMSELTRPVTIPFMSNKEIFVGEFLGKIAQAVEALCCAAIENDR
ncbi:MAG: RHS repeat-associated core domain-containing protein [Verrucomicrobiales bacterium]|nr:RHS repeat-associated core domain-containing protein [Verrucomicrobiales bacterium]